jgi:hypothetical protein
MIADLTEAQRRVLSFMDACGPRWFTLLELDRVRLLHAGDVLTVPSLIERVLLMSLALPTSINDIRPNVMVALTASGAVLADEIRSGGYLRGRFPPGHPGLCSAPRRAHER